MDRSGPTPFLRKPWVLAAVLAFGAWTTPAGVIGTNSVAEGLTPERVKALPDAERNAWLAYLKRSKHQAEQDRRFFLEELQKHNLKESRSPAEGRSGSNLPLNQPAAWYRGEDGRRIADIVVSFQTPAGGWGKNLDMTRQRRAPGEHFAPHRPFRPTPGSEIPASGWDFVGTFDNRATTTQLRYLAKVITALGPEEGRGYVQAFRRGIAYVFAAQFPNGGWPQVWPLQGGYHDAITYNDSALANVIELLQDIAQARTGFGFIDAPTREEAADRVRRGLRCVIATQIKVKGVLTAWCQQHDALTLAPTPARNYEMPSLSGSESAGVLSFLMRLPEPDIETVRAVHAAAAWFEQTRLRDVAFKRVDDTGRKLVRESGAGPLWARYMEIGTNRPLFGDRDRTIHDRVEEISKERREGYSWFSDAPQEVLEEYARWRKKHPQPAPGQ